MAWQVSVGIRMDYRLLYGFLPPGSFPPWQNRGIPYWSGPCLHPSSSAKSFTVHIPRNALKIAGIAFGVGVLLFVLVWFTGRDKLPRRPGRTDPQETAQVEPLPEPLAAAAGSSDMPDAKPAPVEEEAPKLVETPPPPPAPVAGPGRTAPRRLPRATASRCRLPASRHRRPIPAALRR